MTARRVPRFRGRVLGPAAFALLLLAAPAHAVAPGNDAASQAVDVAPIGAENGSTTDRQGVAELGEAGPDDGTPRCLGAQSFQRTAWFRVPGGPVQRLRLDAFVAPGQPDEVAELAAFVQPAGATTPRTTEPQACDGPETGSADAGVELAVGAGHDTLVQVGLPAGSKASQVVLSVDAEPLRQLEPPDGDELDDPLSIPFAKVRKLRVRGATVGVGDPAQPACPAGHTIWRKRTIRQSGLQVVQARGSDVSTLTAFVGKRPTGTNVRDCDVRSSSKTEALAARFSARRGQVAWVRLGTDDQVAGPVRTAFSGPCDQTPLQPLTVPRVSVSGAGKRPRAKRTVGLRLRTSGPCLARTSVTVRRGGRIVARGAVARLVRGTHTLRLRRLRGAKAPRGAYRVSISARVPKGKRRTFGTTRTVRLR